MQGKAKEDGQNANRKRKMKKLRGSRAVHFFTVHYAQYVNNNVITKMWLLSREPVELEDMGIH